MSEQLDPITNLPEETVQLDLSQLGKTRLNTSAAIGKPMAQKDYNNYSSGMTPYMTQEQQDLLLSENQGFWETGGNMLGRTSAKLLPSIAQGFAYLEDVVTGTPDGNFISNSMGKLIEDINQNYALYANPNNKIINAENIEGLITSVLSFAATGMGVGSVLGKLGNIGRTGSALNNGMNALAQLGTATALTGIEGAMESNELLKQSFRGEYDKQYMNFINQGLSQEEAALKAEELAKTNVEKAAKTAMLTNYLNVALNLTSAGYFLKGGGVSKFGRLIDKPSDFFSKHTGLELLKEGSQEALEEGVNVFSQATGKTQLAGQKLTFDNIWGNIDKDELKASMVLGAIGGIGQTAISFGVGNINTKWYKGRNVVLREKYAEQKDFLDKVMALNNDPSDQSSNLLNITHNLALLQQAQELENNGDKEGAQTLRMQTMAYNVFESFKNGTWKDLKDFYSQLSNAENLTEEQKADITKLTSYFDKYQKIYSQYVSSLTDGKKYPFSMYSNRVNDLHLREEYNNKVKESRDLDSKRAQEHSEIDELDISQNEKIKRKNTVTATYNPQIAKLNQETADLHKSIIGNDEQYYKLFEDNIDSMDLANKTKSLVKNRLTARKNNVGKATTNEELDNALAQFDNDEIRDQELERASRSQSMKASTIDYSSPKAFGDSLLNRWRNNAALARTEKRELEKIMGKTFSSTSELIDAVFSENPETLKKIDALNAAREAAMKDIDNKKFDNLEGRRKGTNKKVIYKGDKAYVIEEGSGKITDNVQDAASRSNIKPDNVRDEVNRFFDEQIGRLQNEDNNNIAAVKEFFDKVNEIREQQLVDAITLLEASLPEENVTIEDNETGTEASEEKLTELVKGTFDNIPITHWEVTRDGKPNDKFDPRFREGLRLMQTGELQGKTLYFETSEEDLNLIGNNFPGSTTAVNNNNYTVYLVYYKDGNKDNKVDTNRVLVSKLRSDIYQDAKGNTVQLNDSLKRVRAELLKQKGSGNLQLATTTKVNSILIGKLQTGELRSVKNILKPNERLILGVVVKKGNILDLETNGAIDDMSTVIYDRTKLRAGAVYMMTKTPSGTYIPVQLDVKRVNNLDKAEEIKEELSKLLDEFLSPNANYGEIQKKIAKYVYGRFMFSPHTPNTPFFTVRTLNEQGKIVRNKKPVYLTKEQMLEILMNDFVQVNSKEINKSNYNDILLERDALQGRTEDTRFTLNNIKIDYPTWGSATKATTATTTPVNNSTEAYESTTEDDGFSDQSSFNAIFGNESEEVTPVEEVKPLDANQTNDFVKAIIENQSQVKPEKIDNKYHIGSELYHRVSNVIDPKRDGSNNKSTAATDLGTQIDAIIRDVFNGVTPAKPDNMTDKAFNQLMEQVELIKSKILSKAKIENVLANNIVVWDVRSKVAGELDILAFNDDGTITLYDIKTSTSTLDYENKYRKKHNDQLSAYGALLFNQYGFKVTNYEIIPIELNYTQDGDLIGVEGKEFISHTFNEGITEIIKSNLTYLNENTVTNNKSDNKQVGASNKQFKPRKKSTGKGDATSIKEKELARLNRVLPTTLVNKTKFMDEIERIGDLVTYGLYEDGVITLMTKTQEGTSYHEAVHAIVDLFLTPKQRTKLLKEVAKEHTPTQFELDYYSSLYPEATNEQIDEIALEEYLAEKFRLYALDREKLESAPKEQKSLMQRIIDWFENIFSNLSNKNKVDRFFKNTYEGKYKNGRKFAMNTSFSMRSLKSMDVFEREQRVGNLKYMYVELLDELRQLPVFENENDLKIINGIGFENMVKILATRVLQDRNALDNAELDQEDYNYYAGKFDNFLNSLVDMENSNVKEGIEFSNGSDVEGLNFLNGGNIIIDFKLNGELPLMSAFINELASLGINIKFNRKQVKIDNNDDQNVSEFPEEGNIDGEVSEDRGFESQYTWQFNANQVSSEESFSAELKRQLQTIAKSEEETDDLGYLTFEDYNTVRNFLIENISDTYTKDEMMEKLKELAPYSNYSSKIYQLALSNPQFATDLYVHIASKSDTDYAIVKTVDSNSRVIRSNRNNITMLIIEDLKVFFNKSKILSDKFSTNRSGKQINLDEAKKFHDAMMTFDKELKKLDSYFIEDPDEKNPTLYLKEEYVQAIADLFREYSIDVSKEQLQSLANKGRKHFYSFFTRMVDVSVDLVNNKNIFTLEEEQMDKEGTRLEKIAKLLVPVTQHKSEKSFLTVNSTKIFSHTNTNFIKEFMSLIKGKNRKTTLEPYGSDVFFGNSFLVQEILNDQIDLNTFRYLTLDGSELVEDRKVDFESMEAFDLSLLTIEAFYNQNHANAYYRLPVFSDSPQSGFIMYKKIKNPKNSEEFWNKVYSTALQEYNRMQFVNDNADFFSGVKNVLKRNKAYILSPFLNEVKNGTKVAMNINLNTEEGKAKLMELAKEYYANEFQKEIERLINVGVLMYNNEGKVSSKVLSRNMFNDKTNSDLFENLNIRLEEYFYNSTLMNTQWTSLFSGDPAYYKTNNDWQKRNKQVMSPIVHLDTSVINPTYQTINLQDVEVDVIHEVDGNRNPVDKISKFGTFINTIFNNHPKLQSIIADYKKTSLTDAQAFITPRRYKEIMQGLRRWTPAHETIYKKLVKGEELLDDEIENVYTEYWNIFGSLKPFDFHHNKQMTIDGETKSFIYPYQVKRAEFLLIPQVIKDIPELKSLYDKAISLEKETGKAVAINYDSAIKDGAHNVYSSISVVPSDPKRINTVELSNDRYGLQVEVPTHFIEDENNFGTQIMKLIVSGKNEATIYTPDQIPNFKKLFGDRESVTHKEVTDLYKTLINTNLKHSSDKLTGEIKNRRAFKKLLKNSGLQNKLPNQYYETLGSEFEHDFPLPLWFPPFGKTNETVLHSLLRNRVVKQKFPGASLVNVSSIGFDDKLKVVIKDNNFVHFEARLPYWTKAYFKDLVDSKTGDIDMKKLHDKYGNDEKKIADLLDVIAYRIPTEWKHSMFKIRVVGFMHPLQGGAIQLPTEATKISGFDFDIDKLYAMFPSIDFSKSKQNGRLERYDYDSESILDPNKSNDIRFNALLDLMNGILAHPTSATDIFEPSSFDDLKITAQRIYLTKKGYDGFGISEKEVTRLIEEEELDLILPSTQYEYIERNRVGKALIGFFANHNTCHSFAEKTLLESKQLVTFDGVDFSMLNRIVNEEGEKIGKVLASSIASSTDNAKDPIASFMNLNTFTVDSFAFLYRLGVPKETVQLFLAQDSIVELAKHMLDTTNNESAYLKFLTAKNKEFDLLFSMGLKVNKRPPSKAYNITTEELRNAIKDSKEVNDIQKKINKLKIDLNVATNRGENVNDINRQIEQLEQLKLYSFPKYFETQYKVFNNFKQYYRIAQDLGNLSTSIKLDSTNNRSTLMDLEIAKTKFFNIGNLTGLDSVEEFFEDTLLQGFYDYGIATAQDLFGEHLPWLTPGFSAVRNTLIDKAGARLDRKVLNRVNYMILTYFGSKFEYFAKNFNESTTQREAVISNITDLITNFVQNNPDNKYTPFLRRFQSRTSKYNNREFETLQFYKNGLNAKDRQSMMDKFEQMLAEPVNSPEYNIANRLVQYSFYKNGFTSDAISYSELIPPSFYINLKDSTGKSFIDYLNEEITSFSTGFNNKETLDLVDIIVRNSSQAKGFIGNHSINSFSITNTDNAGLPTHLAVNKENLTLFLTSEGKFSKFAGKPLSIADGHFKDYIVVSLKTASGKQNAIFKLNNKTNIITNGESTIEYYRIANKGIGMYSLELYGEQTNLSKSLSFIKEDSQPTDGNNLTLLEIEQTGDITLDDTNPTREELNKEMDNALTGKKQEGQLTLFDEMIEEANINNQSELTPIFEENDNQSDGFYDQSSFNSIFGDVIESTNKDILDAMIDLYPVAEQKQIDALKEIGINSLEELRMVDINNIELIEKINEIKCM